ncbi:lipocalin-1 interacting membrane receptor, putative [Pediculus humanus corporis]|uniref:Lipocalin-1 interacting membrane receptor, putative n=1 Tax=Pediculus humanus subsp. corporis TaxID=121224 RepID=E0V9N5_PEDHC|nr:lipocalin-1 interacting membrane receptor, putative [Pediculus humanus corporis]EEB10104.1 lipocalin-1 interacting membrane receptor, putative [Pediculus humanus corporis]
MENDTDIREQLFHNTVRENVIFLILFIVLYIISFTILGQLGKKEGEQCSSTDSDDVAVYNISFWLCSFSFSVSTGAALLLPISIISNEVLLLYPNSYYVKWLNSSLIQGLWNHVFLFSNLSLFILLPFAYLFMESEGFPGSKKGLWARAYETFTVLCLVAVLVLGMTYIMSALIDGDISGRQTLFICTPLGFVRLFTVVGQFLFKPQFLRDINEEYNLTKLEEDCIRRRLENVQKNGKAYISPPPIFPSMFESVTGEDDILENTPKKKKLFSLQNGALQMGLKLMLSKVEKKTKLLDVQRRASLIQRNFVYPGCMLLLFALTGIAVLIVVQNTLELLIGIKALPLSTRQFSLGISSLSKLGPFGAAIEIVLILYMQATSSVGLYTLPFIKKFQPKLNNTPLSHTIANCALLLILSSALPLISRILGITNFDLMGDFGKIVWLGNFKIVLMYNVLFAGAATLCLTNKFTTTVRRELFRRLRGFASAIFSDDTTRHIQITPSPSHSLKED